MAWQDSDITGGKVRVKHSQTAAEGIGATGLVPGEIALNAADKKILFKDSAGAVQAIPAGVTNTLYVQDENSNTLTLVFVNGLLVSHSS